MTTFSVPDSTPTPSPPPHSPNSADGAYPQSPRTPPKQPRNRRSPPISPLPPRPGFSQRILKAARKPQPTRWLATWGCKIVAVKKVPANSRCTLDVVRRLSRQLNYPGLIRVIDYHGFGGKDALDLKNRTISWEYGDLGTLSDLLYKNKNQNGVEESLVWHVLFALLKSALYIHTGERYQPAGAWGRPPAEWQPTVHNAINPDNIFLMSPKTKGGHPIVKLGNFAKAVILPSREHETDNCTFPHPGPDQNDLTGFEAPEITWQRPRADLSVYSVPIGARSDMWSIAVVAVAMMGSIARNVEPRLGTQKKVSLHPWKRLMMKSLMRRNWDENDLPMEYSSQLRRFLARILVIEPKTRMEAKEALSECYEWHREYLGEQ